MRYALLTALLLALCASPAAADHIGIYSDATGSSCRLYPGFTSTATIVHKYSLGATGSRFMVEFPAGSSFFAFNTTWVPIGTLDTDLSLGYGQCMQGNFVLGTIVAILGTGQAWLKPATGFTNIWYADCEFVERPASGRGACISASYCDEYECPVWAIVAVRPTTWGAVKALYR